MIASLLEVHSQCACQRFCLSFHNTALLHIKCFQTSQCRHCITNCYSSYVHYYWALSMVCCFNCILSKLLYVKLYFVYDFTGCKIMHDCMASMPIHCLFKPLLMCRTDGIVLAYLNCHMFILFVVVFTLVGQLASYSDLLVCL